MTPLSPFRLLAPSGSKGRLSIFIFHRVLEVADPLRPGEPDTVRFGRIAAFLARHFTVLSLTAATAALAQGRLPPAAACITFDDGYADNLTLAAPILTRYGLVATVFVATAFTGGGRMWNDSIIEAVREAPAGEIDWRDLGLGHHAVDNDASRLAVVQATLSTLKFRDLDERSELAAEIARRAGLAPSSALMMTREQLVAWRDLGLEVGGHTINHPILARLSEAEALVEIADGRRQLTDWLGEAPRSFAYPNGMPERDWGDRDAALVARAGYESAVTTARGAARVGTDPYGLPRFTPWDAAMWAFGARCAQTLLVS